jgi:actin-related protein
MGFENFENNPIILLDSFYTNVNERKKIMETFFEEFEIPFFTLQQHPLMALYTTGENNGIVIDSGKINIIKI